MAKGTKNAPKIEAVLSTKTGNPLTRAPAGTPIRIVGSGFGEDPGKVRIFFDDLEARPYAMPFSDGSLVVACPMPGEATSRLYVQAGRQRSGEVDFMVMQPGAAKGDVGAATAEFFQELDQFAAMVASLAYHAAPVFDLRDELRQAAEYLEGGRLVLRRNLELMMLWKEPQAGIDFAPLRVIERIDEVITLGGLTQQVAGLTANIFGTSGVVGTVLEGAGALGSSIFGIGAETVRDIISVGADLIGFVLKEGAKLLEGAENLLKIFVFSGSGDTGVSIGGEATLGIDVSFSPGEGVSAIAKGVDIVAQIFEKISDLLDGFALDEKLDRLEEKADRQGEALDRLEGKADRHEEKLDVLESKADRQEEKLDRHEEKLDVLEVKADRHEQKLDKLEGKADRHEEKLDVLESKADRQEQKLDGLEAKADRQEEKLDVLEVKADRQEQKLDAIESKADRQEEKLDKLEEKADRHEQKLDRIEEKNDRQEGKLDKLEVKADRHEQKLDKLEAKADRQEKKLDRIESKADRHEQKQDRLEGKADRQERKLDSLEGKADREEQKLDRLEGKADRHEEKLDKLEEKNDRQEEKLDRLEEKADRIEEKQDREEEKLDRLTPMPPFEGSIANQRGSARRVTAAVAALRGVGNDVFLRAAIDQDAADLDDVNAWSPWVSFGRPANAGALTEVSIDLQYEEGSDTTLSALLSARSQDGRVYHRVFERKSHDVFLDPTQWTAWQMFLGQP